MPTRSVPALAAVLTASLTLPLAAQEVFEGHGFAMHGDVKYAPDFTHFDYVNPDAPKGGTLTMHAEGSFDNLNFLTASGTAPVAYGLTLDTLMVSSADEPFTMYCLICSTIRVPAARDWVEFDIDPAARFHDGSPITPEDVIFTFETWTSQIPRQRFYYNDVESVAAVDADTVRFDFVRSNPEMPLILGQLPIVAKAGWESRDTDAITMEPYLTSGPYRFGRINPGQSVAVERVEDYWAADHPTRRGTNNFDRVIYDYYRDATVAHEAFLAGEYDLRSERIAKQWATGYDVPEVEAGVIVMAMPEDGLPDPMQGWYYNLRQPQFQDPVVREALAYAFDFEWTNANLFNGLYTRSRSFFGGSDLEATGLPSPAELELLEPWRGQIPERVFTETYEPPSTEGSSIRANLRTAAILLDEAGWTLENGVRTKDGVALEFDILLRIDSTSERIVLPFVENLNRIGAKADLLRVDPSAFVERVRNFEFDMVTLPIGQSLSPGNEQISYWGSEAADEPDSANYTGIADPAIDAVIDRLVTAETREELETATQALDRLLQWNFVTVPQYHNPVSFLAYWDKFGHPPFDPPVMRGLPLMSWWYDADKAATLDQRRAAAR